MKKISKALRLFSVVMSFILALAGCSGGSSSASSNTNQPATASNANESAPDETVYEMRLVLQHPETTQHGKNSLKFKEVVEKHTNGRVTVTLYPAGQLGGPDKEPQMVASGSVEAMHTYNGTIISLVPEEMIYDIPFLFDVEPGDERLIKAVQGNALINDAISAGAERAGFKTLGNAPTCYGVFVVANNKRPVQIPQDAAGLQIRLAASEMLKIIIDSMGAAPVSIAASEVPVGLSQGVFDGLVTTLAYYHDARWHTKYITTNFATGGSYPIYVNLNWWNNLPQDLQDVIETQAMPELWEYCYEAVSPAEAEVVNLMQQDPYNVEVTRFDMDDPAIKQWVEETQQKGIDHFVGITGEVGQAMVDEVLKIRAELFG